MEGSTVWFVFANSKNRKEWRAHWGWTETSSSTSRLWEEESENKHSVYLGTDDLEERAKVVCKLDYSGWTACYWSSWERLKKNTVRATTGQELSPSSAPKQRHTGDLHS